jgi:Fe2+ or Zn2+ uptake regulation protein
LNMQDILVKLKEHGYKITPQRQEIINVLVHENRHMTVEDIHNQISARFPNLSVDTVYRNVGMLERLEMLDKTDFGDGVGRYKLVGKVGHRHHIICLNCGCSEEVDFCPLDYLDQQQIKDKNFAIARHNFEIFGYCARCLKKEE